MNDIREGMERIILQDYEPHDGWNISLAEVASNILTFLDKNNVVQIEEKELPDNEAWHRVEREFEAYCAGKNDVFKWHKDSIKRLI